MILIKKQPTRDIKPEEITTDIIDVAMESKSVQPKENLLVMITVFQFLLQKYTDNKNNIENLNISDKQWLALKQAIQCLEETYGDDIYENGDDLDGISEAERTGSRSFDSIIRKELESFLKSNLKDICKKANRKEKALDPNGEGFVLKDYWSSFLFEQLPDYYFFNRCLILKCKDFKEYLKHIKSVIEIVLLGSRTYKSDNWLMQHAIMVLRPLRNKKKPSDILLAYNSCLDLFLFMDILLYQLRQPFFQQLNIIIAQTSLKDTYEGEIKTCIKLVSFCFSAQKDFWEIFQWSSKNILSLQTQKKYDAVITDLPATENESKSIKDFRTAARFPETQKADILVIYKAIDLLKKDGLASILVLDEILSSDQDDYVAFRKHILDKVQVSIDKLDIWSNRGYSAGIFLSAKRKRDKVRFVYTNTFFKKLQKAVKNGKDIESVDKDGCSILVGLEEIATHGYNLSMSLWNNDYISIKKELEKYSNLWQLGKICKIYKGACALDTTTLKRGNIPVITGPNLKRNAIDYDSIRQYLPKDNLRTACSVSEKAILLCQKGKRTLVAEFDPLKAKYKTIIISDSLVALILTEEKVRYDYLLCYLSSSIAQKQLYLFSRNHSGYFSDIDLPSLRKIKIPHLDTEQQLAQVEDKSRTVKKLFLQENKLLGYLAEFKFYKTLEETMKAFENYLRNELGQKIKIDFRYKEDIKGLYPFSVEDIRSGLYFKIISNSEAAFLVRVHDKPYAIINIKGRRINYKISKETAFRFSTIGSFVIQSFLRVQDAADEKMADSIAHEFKNASRKIIDSIILVKNKIETSSLKNDFVIKERNIEEIIASRNKGSKEDFRLQNYLNSNILDELNRVKNIATKIDEYRKMSTTNMSKLDIVFIIKQLAKDKKANLKTKHENLIIQGVESPLKTALSNLIENAIEHSPDGKCEIELQETGESIKVILKNRVDSVLPNDLLKTLGKSSIRTKKGGLGFYHSKRFIEENNKGFFKFNYDKNRKEFIVTLEFLRKGWEENE